MAIIYSYPKKTTPAGGDFLVITDSEQTAPNKNRTKSLTVGDLASFVMTSKSGITGSGTLNTVPIFTGSTTIGDSIITYDVPGSSIKINGNAVIGSVSTDILTVDAQTFFNERVKSNVRIDILNATSSSKGLKFLHPAGGSSSTVDMYYNGVAAGSKFVISRSATGGAEIELQANGDVNLNRTGNGNILLSNLQLFADEAAATAAGLAAHTLYQTDGTAAAPLNVAGIVMIKQ